MNTKEEVIDIIKKARLFSILITIISLLVGLAGLGSITFASFGIFENPSNLQIFVLITALIITLITAWIGFTGIEKVTKLNNLLMKDEFLTDIAKNMEDGVVNLWRNRGGEKIFFHMAEINAPAKDQEDLLKSKKKTIDGYLKVKSKTRKALKNGWFTLWMIISEIDEEYTTWLDETWDSTSSYISFYTQAYESVTEHKQIPERLMAFKKELINEFVEDEASNGSMINIPSDSRFFKFQLLYNAVPSSAFEADAQIEMMRHIDATADEEIESAISNAYSSGEAAGMSQVMMQNAITQVMHNATHHNN